MKLSNMNGLKGMLRNND